MTSWQDIAALAVVAAALLTLVVRIASAIRRKKLPGCGGCGGCDTVAPPLVQIRRPDNETRRPGES
jgi:hypothetical protein